MRGGRGRHYRANDLSYADDLCTPAQSPEELQLKANVISAFCAVFRIELNAEKMRSFQTPPHITSNFALTIYNSKWEPTYLLPRPGHILPYLGSEYETNYTGETELKRLSTYILNALTSLTTQCITAPMKLYALKASIFATATYSLKHLPLRMKQLNSLEKKIRQFYKLILHHMDSFSTHLLHAPIEDGGLGLPILTETIFLAKWGMTQRGLFSPDSITSQATEALLESTLLQTTQPNSQGMQVILQPPSAAYHSKSLFSDLLTEYGHSKDMYLCRKGTSRVNIADQVIPQATATFLQKSLIHKSSGGIPGIKQHVVRTYGDIIGSKEGHPTWHLAHFKPA